MKDRQDMLRRLDHYAWCMDNGVHVTGSQMRKLVLDIREIGLLHMAPPVVETPPKFNPPPAEAQPCGCGEATCTVPWEPGCGLGKSEQHAEAQAQGGGEVVAERHALYGIRWIKQLRDMKPGTQWFIEGRAEPIATVTSSAGVLWHTAEGEIPHGTKYYTAPPSAPVGVETVDAAAWIEVLELPEGFRVAEHLPGIWEYQFDIEDEADEDSDRRVSGASWNHPAIAAIAAWGHAYDALAQQPASDGGFTAADMMDARQEGRKEAQQPAGFSAGDMSDASAQGFRAGVESVQQPAAVDGADAHAAEIEALRADKSELEAALEYLKAHRVNASLNQDGVIKALTEVRDDLGAEIHRLRAELEIEKGQADFYRTTRNWSQQKAERLAEALRDLLSRAPGGYECDEFHHSKDDRHGPLDACPPMQRWHAALDDAHAALRDHDQEGKGVAGDP